jgi:hypothetical protein
MRNAVGMFEHKLAIVLRIQYRQSAYTVCNTRYEAKRHVVVGIELLWLLRLVLP